MLNIKIISKTFFPGLKKSKLMIEIENENHFQNTIEIKNPFFVMIEIEIENHFSNDFPIAC